jgi:hypothetical protein
MSRTLAALVIALALPSAASATLFTYQATLDGASEFPASGSAGTGTATVIYDDTSNSLTVNASFTGLTGQVTAAHIHCCVSPSAPVPNAGVATPTPTFPGFPSGVTAGSYSQPFDLTQASSWNAAFITSHGGTVAAAEAAFATALAGGLTYFNIHSDFRPGGEIRGFLTPEPSTALLVGAGIALLARRRREQP